MIKAPAYCFLLLSAWLLCVGELEAQDGFCMVNGATTGGAGGAVVTVTNGTDFNTQINVAGPRIVQVQGVLSIGRVFTTANKSIIGLGTNATLLGNINVSDTTNVIIRNLRITAPANDGLTIWNAQHVWIDHCTIYDTGDGLCDMNRGSQYVTVSWCMFHYLSQVEHRFAMIADGYDNGAGVTNWGYYTLHHNWWSSGDHERLPSSSYGRIHMYNNYYTCSNNFYAALARVETEFVSENNYYSGVNNPIYNGTYNGKIRTAGNIYAGCAGTISPGTDVVFAPPYSYTLDLTATVPTNLIANAGAPGPAAVAIPPKIWDGGGSDNNLNTANNWALNEMPKADDILIFAGGTQLAPNNNITANTEFYGITFSNTAGAFVLGGNALNIGGPIVDDSAVAQTINANLDFGFGQFHYTTNRACSVSAPAGSLVINGNLAGATNAYFDSYCFTKDGPGLLTLNGTNTFAASLQLNGGLVAFKTLDTNQPGSLGAGTVLNFNGGALRWAAANTADISVRKVTIQAGGATFDSGTNNVVLANPIGNNGTGGLTKLGSGTLTLNGNNSYSRPTVIAMGRLALGSSGTIANSTAVILSNSAVLDVSGRSDHTLTLGSGKTLTGHGSVHGSVTASNGSIVAPGPALGVLTVTNILTLQNGSTTVIELNASSHTNDLIAGMANVSYGGQLTVTNIGGALAAGDRFKLFEARSFSNSFATVVLPTLAGNLTWSNRLAIDGTLAVVQPVNTSPANIELAAAGNTLRLNWPADHIGWRLEAQTNQLGLGLGTNWFPIAGSDQTNQLSFGVTNDCVFFRLVYP